MIAITTLLLFTTAFFLIGIDSIGAKRIRGFVQKLAKKQWTENADRSEDWVFDTQISESFPEPVRRYLEMVDAWERKPASVYKMRQKGAYRRSANAIWQPVEAKFFCFPILQSSLWYADITPGLFFSVKAVLFFEKQLGKSWLYFLSVWPLKWKIPKEKADFFMAWQLAAQMWNPSIFQSKEWNWIETQDGLLLRGQVANQNLEAQVFFDAEGLIIELRLPHWRMNFSEYRNIQGWKVPGTFSIQKNTASDQAPIYQATTTDVAYEGNYRWW
jgi:hypothetical protein